MERKNNKIRKGTIVGLAALVVFSNQNLLRKINPSLPIAISQYIPTWDVDGYSTRPYLPAIELTGRYKDKLAIAGLNPARVFHQISPLYSYISKPCDSTDK